MKITVERLREMGFVEMPSGNWIKTTTGGNAELIEPSLVAKPEPPPKAPKRIRQSSKPLLNKLEQEFHDNLKYQWKVIASQAVRFKLGNGIWYKPDFVAWPMGLESQDTRLRAYEVKGPFAHRGGFENLKVAAGLYPQVLFALVWKSKDGNWQEQRILP